MQETRRQRVDPNSATLIAMARCFVTRQLPGNQSDRIVAAGHDLDLWPKETPPPQDKLIAHAAQADALLCMLTDRIDAELLDAAPKLRVVSTMAVGYDNIDVNACRQRGVLIGHTPDVLTEATADLTLALLLALARRLPEGIAAVNDGSWSSWSPNWLLGVELRDLTVGIVGPGRIGRAVSRRCGAFGMKVIESGRPGGERPGMPLNEMLALADVVSIHCPLNDSTEALVSSEFLAAMKPTALLVNTSRGGIVDQIALAKALHNRTIAGAALDVTTPEPLPPSDPLLNSPNLIVTPHLGSATTRTREAMATKAVDNLLAGLAGEPLPDCVT